MQCTNNFGKEGLPNLLTRAAKMKDPTMFTIAVLKERLRQMNLSASGNKVKLIAKLMKRILRVNG